MRKKKICISPTDLYSMNDRYRLSVGKESIKTFSANEIVSAMSVKEILQVMKTIISNKGANAWLMLTKIEDARL